MSVQAAGRVCSGTTALLWVVVCVVVGGWGCSVTPDALQETPAAIESATNAMPSPVAGEPIVELLRCTRYPNGPCVVDLRLTQRGTDAKSASQWMQGVLQDTWKYVEYEDADGNAIEAPRLPPPDTSGDTPVRLITPARMPRPVLANQQGDLYQFEFGVMTRPVAPANAARVSLKDVRYVPSSSETRAMMKVDGVRLTKRFVHIEPYGSGESR